MALFPNLPLISFFFFFFFNTRSHVAQTGLRLCVSTNDLESLIFLLLLSKCWDYRHGLITSSLSGPGVQIHQNMMGKYSMRCAESPVLSIDHIVKTHGHLPVRCCCPEGFPLSFLTSVLTSSPFNLPCASILAQIFFLSWRNHCSGL